MAVTRGMEVITGTDLDRETWAEGRVQGERQGESCPDKETPHKEEPAGAFQKLWEGQHGSRQRVKMWRCGESWGRWMGAGSCRDWSAMTWASPKSIDLLLKTIDTDKLFEEGDDSEKYPRLKNIFMDNGIMFPPHKYFKPNWTSPAGSHSLATYHSCTIRELCTRHKVLIPSFFHTIKHPCRTYQVRFCAGHHTTRCRRLRLCSTTAAMWTKRCRTRWRGMTSS